MEKWTEAQKQAVFANEGEYLVVAGAGAGKTKVLTARIGRLIEEGKATVDQLLVLTFTRKAAQEMKDRVRGFLLARSEELLKEGSIDLAKRLREQADLSIDAEITTFDAFSLSLVRKYCHELKVPSHLTIGDEGILKTTRIELLNEILEERYASENDVDASAFLREYCIKDDEPLRNLVLSILDAANLRENESEYFDFLEDTAFEEENAKRVLKTLHERLKEEMLKSFDSLKRCEEPDIFGKYETALESVLAAASYDAFFNAFQNLGNFPSLRGISSYDKAIAAAFRNKINDGIKKKVLEIGDTVTAVERYRNVKPFVKTAVGIARELSLRFSNWKEGNALYDFADIARMAYMLTQDKEIGKLIRNQYNYILIDEYQDTSDLQEAFINSVSNGNLFMVGDVKQSIYRFRHANPKIILSRMERYRKDSSKGKLITLAHNFRSEPALINDINKLFELCMTKALGDIDYGNGQQMIAGRNPKCERGDFGISVLKYENEDETPIADAEAEVIAHDIEKRVKEGCDFKDFAILIARKRDFATYSRIFEKHQIPVDITNEEDLSADNLSLCFIGLLNLIVAKGDAVKEKHGFASLMRSYLVRMSDKELHDLLADGSYKKNEHMEYIRSNRSRFLRQESAKTVNELFEHFDFFGKLPRLGRAKMNIRKLHFFKDIAIQHDALHKSFNEYVEHFSDLEKFEVKFAVAPIKKNVPSVKLMSIHASKGLEFPIVYLPDISTMKKGADSLDFTATGYGVSLPFVEDLCAPTVFPAALEKNMNASEDLSERMRLFYVAATRAKEKVIFVERIDPKIKCERALASPGTEVIVEERNEKEGEDESKLKIKKAKSFRNFLNLASDAKFPSYESKPKRKETPVPDNMPCPKRLVSIRRIDIKGIPAVSKSRASKLPAFDIDEGALRYGERLHALLELLDLKRPDFSLISDLDDRKRIEKAHMALDASFDLKTARIYKEYAYSIDGENGVIDLLLVYEDRAIVIDYKASSIEAEEYETQVRTYTRMVERLFNRPCSSFLLSIIHGTLKEVR